MATKQLLPTARRSGRRAAAGGVWCQAGGRWGLPAGARLWHCLGPDKTLASPLVIYSRGEAYFLLDLHRGASVVQGPLPSLDAALIAVQSDPV